jgi:hypothetical protein
MRRKRHHFDDFGEDDHARATRKLPSVAEVAAFGIGAVAARSLSARIDALLTDNAPVRRSNNGPLEVDCSGSTCFESVEWQDGVASYVFRDGYADDFPMDRSEFRDWQTDGSPGGWFNENLRPETVKGSDK